jgi:hypothetical protein
MNYEQIYNQLIDRAKTRVLTGYKERHHIIPRCVGGSDDASNLVDLTAREHFIAHKLLCEIYPNNSKLLYAYWLMSNKAQSNNQQRNYTVSSQEYERIKLLISESRKSFTHSNETKFKISQSSKGRTAWNKGKQHSNETKQKLNSAWSIDRRKQKSASQIGKQLPLETKNKMSDAHKGQKNHNYGKPKTDEIKQKISNTLTGRKTGPQSEEHKRKRIESFKNTIKSKNKL